MRSKRCMRLRAVASRWVMLWICSTFFPLLTQLPKDAWAAENTAKPSQGALRVTSKAGKKLEKVETIACPLLHTDVKADISGFIARVKVTQTFKNPLQEKIEAVYEFPLPHQAAVDRMTMVIGQRRIVGLIKRRETARRIYQQALEAGWTSALLEQHRPNIFRQSVGNIEPGQEIDIEISYVEVLDYDQGRYEFHFPMVVGPRYHSQFSPGRFAGVEAKTIDPPLLAPKQRTGHDVSLTVNLEAGVPVGDLTIANHKVQMLRKGPSRARVRLLQEDSVPNKDFVLRYKVAGRKPQMAVLAHTGSYSSDQRDDGSSPERQGYFMLMVQPQEDERLSKSPPREVVYLVDVSGSMRGAPTAKVRDAMQKMIKLCREQDTMQVITFASQANKLFDKPVPVNDANRKRALEFADGQRGGGGTEMLKGVKMAIDQPIDKDRLRIIVMLTDGFIGNEAQIIQHVGENCGDQIRFWVIGIGQSPNMFLVNGVARQGGGMGKKLGLNDDTQNLTTEVMTRIQRAQLADIEIDWGGLKVNQVLPAKIPELWAGRPVVVFGRYQDGGEGEITVRGRAEGQPVRWPLQVSLPKEEKQHDVLASVWARKKIEDLMQQTYYQDSPAVEEEVTSLALSYRLMSQYTSFVAVDAKEAQRLDQSARPPRKVIVPVPIPEGTQWESFGGRHAGFAADMGDELGGEMMDGGMMGGMMGGMPRGGMRGGMGGRMIGGMGGSGMGGMGGMMGGMEAGMGGGGMGGGGGGMMGGMGGGGMGGGGGGFGGGGMGGFGGGGGVPGGGRIPRHRVQRSGSFPFIEKANQHLYAPLFTGHREAAAKLLAAKVEDQQQSESQERLMSTRAFLLDTAATAAGHSDGQIAHQALADLKRRHQQLVKQCAASHPVLGRKLDLVLRNQSLPRALRMLAEATGATIEVIAGSEKDAQSMVSDQPLRIVYLDLRRATLAEGLDWITQPLRMEWSLKGETIAVASARRCDRTSAWVYDVATLAIPTNQQWKRARNSQVAALNLAKEFLIAVRRALAMDARSIVWFSPHQLLVVGSRRQHAQVAALLEHLADPNYQPSARLVKLHATTTRRAAVWRRTIQKHHRTRRREHIQQTLEDYGWRLLAAAMGGRLDDEAFAELTSAWSDPLADRLFSDEKTSLRPLWILCEASHLLPQETELAKLAKQVIGEIHPLAFRSLKRLQAKPHDESAYTRVFYASLAERRLAQNGDRYAKYFLRLAKPLVTKPRRKGASTAPMAKLAEVFLDKPSALTAGQLQQLLKDGAHGDEMVALTALASYEAGGEARHLFQSQSRRFLRNQPLRGEVVLLVNRLESREPSAESQEPKDR